MYGSAQRFFLAEGGPLRAPHDLDRDGDGLACEWGPQVRRIASTSIPRVVVHQSDEQVVRCGNRRAARRTRWRR
jgi:hypothetical protein